MSDTVFGKIIRGEIPAERVYETDQVLAFRDVSPVAPKHILVIPKTHIQNAGAAKPEQAELLGKLILAAGEVAKKEGIAESGYRLVMNVGPNGGESVPHLHVHVLGGRQMTWPPG